MPHVPLFQLGLNCENVQEGNFKNIGHYWPNENNSNYIYQMPHDKQRQP